MKYDGRSTGRGLRVGYLNCRAFGVSAINRIRLLLMSQSAAPVDASFLVPRVASRDIRSLLHMLPAILILAAWNF